jgi:hypothetical protein
MTSMMTAVSIDRLVARSDGEREGNSGVDAKSRDAFKTLLSEFFVDALIPDDFVGAQQGTTNSVYRSFLVSALSLDLMSNLELPVSTQSPRRPTLTLLGSRGS